MQANVYTLLYLFFRLSPFIVSCFFTLSSLFQGSWKGIFYLLGLLIACTLTSTLGTMLSSVIGGGVALVGGAATVVAPDPVCHVLTLGAPGSSLSALPLSVAVFSYTLFYLAYSIYVHNLSRVNYVTLFFLPSILFADYWWNMRHHCFSGTQCFSAMAIAGLTGWVYAYFVRMNIPTMQYLYQSSSKRACARTSDEDYVCYETNANGQPRQQ